MKYQIMMGILFTLLSRRKVFAGELAGKFGVSVRTIYRYIDEMTCCNIPIDVSRGPQGGIYISDAFKLPKGLMSKEEYARATDAIFAVNEQLHDPVLESALEKLRAQFKAEQRETFVTGNLLIDGGTWGDERKFSDKLAVLDRAITEIRALEIEYVDRGGERSHRKVFPHLLILKQNVWYLYAFCNSREAFRTFKVGRIRTVIETEETFAPVAFQREEIPLRFWTDRERTVDALFEISPSALPFAEEWLGVENVFERNGKHFAEATLPDDESLVGKILSAGGGFCVVSPASLAERVKKEADRIATLYR